MPPLILVIDDHALYRAGLRMAICEQLPEATLLEAGSLTEALALPSRPDAIILDIKLPGLNGVEGMPLLKRAWPDVPVLILSSQDEPESVKLALNRGADGFISKAEGGETIVAALQSLLNSEKQAASHPQAPQLLTARQLEVLDLICRGLSNKAIGRHLSLSENTVRAHVQAILAALQVASRSEAAFAARRLGLIG